MNIETLKKILKCHNDWLNGEKGEKADLRNADLCGADLYGADLRNADLRDADLRNADLCGAELRDADLRDADLRDADLCDAELRDADLRGANSLEKIYQGDLAILKHQKGKLRAFKYLNGDKAPYWGKEYKAGETYISDDFDKDERKLCAAGLNVATLDWCLRDTDGDLTRTYIEVEFDAGDIVAIPYNTDGKFRVRKLKVIRKIPQEELKEYIKPFYPKEEE